MRPNITDYIESISNPELFFNVLKEIVPERNENGSLVFVSGNMSVVFKVSYKNRFYGLKCYLSNKDFQAHFAAIDLFQESQSSEFFIEFDYYKDELRLYLADQSEVVVDVLMIAWIDGDSLYTMVTESLHFGDRETLSMVTTKFIEFSLRLLSSGLVHGDIKPENIIYDYQTQSLALIDYEACYTQFHQGLSNSEIGTVWYQHPNRTASDYGKKSLDHYSIAILVVSLLAIEQDPLLYHQYNNGNNLLFSPIDIFENKSLVYNELVARWREPSDKQYLLQQLSKESFEIPNLCNTLNLILSLRNGTNGDIVCVVDHDKSLLLTRIYDKYGLIGFMDQNNRIVIDCMYCDSTPFLNGMAGVKINSESYFVNYKGEKISPSYSAILAVGQEVSPVRLGNRCGYVDNRLFKFVIPVQFDKAYNFIDGIARVSLNGSYFFITLYGDPLFDKKFDYCSDFSDGYAVVCSNGFYNIINKEGEMMISDTKTTLYAIRDGFLIISYDDDVLKVDLKRVLSDKIVYFCEKYEQSNAQYAHSK